VSAATPSVSVIVVAHNEGPLLASTVASLREGLPGDAEMIVVDDSSTDGSADFLVGAGSPAQLIQPEERLGISRARNLGGRSARGHVLVFSDAHVEGVGDWLAPIVEALADESVGEVAPAVGWFDRRPGVGYGFTWNDPTLVMRWLNTQDEEVAEVPFICGCFLALRRSVFEETGGFDEGLYHWGYEDSELSLRLWLSGYRCVVTRRAQVTHLFREGFPYPIDRGGVLYNRLRLAAVHLDEPSLAKVIGRVEDRAALGQAWTRLAESDTAERRAALEPARVREFGWLQERFRIHALD
jgi:GT2 family glycosyltransferase